MNDVSDSDQKLSSVMLRARLLARSLRSPELSEWVKLELNGYADRESLPEYRIIYPCFFGHFNGPFGSSTENVPLSTNGFPEEIGDLASQYPLYDNVAAIEQTLAADTDTFTIPQPYFVVDAFRQFGEQISGQALNYVAGVFTKPVVRGILHTIRSRLLEFLIQLAEQHPELETDDLAASNIPIPDVTQTTQRVILQGCTIVQPKNNYMGDSYNANQVGAMGPNAHARDMTFQQLWHQAADEINLNGLAVELRALAPKLSDVATDPEHRIAIGNVEAAAAAAGAGDGPKTLEYLKTAGKWTFDTATKVGIGIGIAAAKSHLGF